MVYGYICDGQPRSSASTRKSAPRIRHKTAQTSFEDWYLPHDEKPPFRLVDYLYILIKSHLALKRSDAGHRSILVLATARAQLSSSLLTGRV